MEGGGKRGEGLERRDGGRREEGEGLERRDGGRREEE